MPHTSPVQRLASLALGEDVTDLVVRLREQDPPPSFRSIATTLRERTDGLVDVTDQTVANWCKAVAERAEPEPQDAA